MEEVRHACGWCVTHSLHDAYAFIKSSQHRGKDAAGIAAVGLERIDVVKWVGRADKFSLGTLYELLDGSSPIFLGHVRYATTGRRDVEQVLNDAHPIAILSEDGEISKRGRHIIMRDCRIVGVHNGQISNEYFEGVDLRNLKTGNDTEKLLWLYDQAKEKEIMTRVPGAYTIAIAEKGRNNVAIMRDRTGIKPGILGWKDGKFVATSEDHALKANGAELREELEPGCVYYMSFDGRSCPAIRVVDADPHNCFFEWNYIAHVESTLSDVQVRTLRRKLGEKLAEEFAQQVNPEEIDYVTYLPSCPKEAAIAFAKELGIQFLPVFYKEDITDRAFQGATRSDREASIRGNLHLIDRVEEKTQDATVIVIDDSEVRGINSKEASKLINGKARIRKGYHLNYTPPIGIIPADGVPRGCMFGVDIPPEESADHWFVARERSLEQISSETGMDTRFISLEGMLSVFEELGIPRDNLCYYCIGGPHPFEGPKRRTQVSVDAT